MKALGTMLYFATALGWAAVGALGFWGEMPAYAPHAWLSLAVGGAMLSLYAIQWTYRPSGAAWPERAAEPRRIGLRWIDYVKAAISWLHAFKHTYAIEPGLYYVGERYDRDAPLLVTSNYHLTVFTVLRHVGSLNVRLLVVDTDGINVWCAAGKGRFSNAAIEEQLGRYERELLTEKTWMTLVLPKLAFAGVDIRGLREKKIRPLIGPVYAKDLPAYLSQKKLTSQRDDQVVFGFVSRLFTWLPGFLQAMGYTLAAALILVVAQGGWVSEAPLVLLGVSAVIATVYPLLFPFIPGRRFAVKGLWLSGLVSLGLAGLYAAGMLETSVFVPTLLFTIASGMFFGLAYTGNSAVSNYSRIRAETARFLPIEALFYTASLIAFVSFGVWG